MTDPKTYAEQMLIFVEAMSYAKDMNDTYTYNHIKRVVATFSRQINKEYRRGLFLTDFQ